MRKRRFIVGGALCAALVLAIGTVPAATWEDGTVFAGIAQGAYAVYDRDGNLLEIVQSTHTEGFGWTTGCAVSEEGDLYGTLFCEDIVEGFSAEHPHESFLTVDTSEHAFGPESIAFAANGDFFVGAADGTRDVLRYNAAGEFQQAYDVETGGRGADWIALSSDQRTLFYTSKGTGIKRFDIVTETQLPDFASLEGFREITYALVLLPPGDGSGGMLVANQTEITRLDAGGTVVGTCDAPGEDTWFALALDTNGTSFWAGDVNTGHIYRFTTETCEIELGPITTPTGVVAGLCVAGDVAGEGVAPQFTAPTSPQCGGEIEVQPGETVSFEVAAEDPDSTADVTLSVAGLPPGATMTPALPLTGNPVSSQFLWIPTDADADSTHAVTWTAQDAEGLSRTCTVTIHVGDVLLVVLQSFTATPGDRQTALDWATQAEIDNAGFFLLRRNLHTGSIVRLGEGLIPARGDVNEGASYRYVDTTALNGVEYEYTLVDVDLHGVETRHPVARATVNPSSSAIHLQSPAYGAELPAVPRLAFTWSAPPRSSVVVRISAHPTFPDGAETMTVPVRVRRGAPSPSEMTFAGPRLRRLEQLAGTGGGRLYWKVVGAGAEDGEVFMLRLPAQSPTRDYPVGPGSRPGGSFLVRRCG